MTTRTYEMTCVDCAAPMTTPRRPPAGGVSCGNGPCLTAHNDRAATAHLASAERRRERAAHRRANPPQRQRLYGDLAAVAAFNGLDAYGRPTQARRRADPN